MAKRRFNWARMPEHEQPAYEKLTTGEPRRKQPPLRPALRIVPPSANCPGLPRVFDAKTGALLGYAQTLDRSA